PVRVQPAAQAKPAGALRISVPAASAPRAGHAPDAGSSGPCSRLRPMKPKSKSDETRARILAAAIDLFRRQGFDATTMRGIGSASEVASGAAFYYFESKDAIVLAFYDQSQDEMAPLLEEALASGSDLKTRVGALLDVKLKYFEPNRPLLGTLASH